MCMRSLLSSVRRVDCVRGTGWLRPDQRLSKTARELKIRNKALLRGGVGPSTTGDG